MTLPEREFAALRTTIASRGTARMVLLPLALTAWAGFVVAVLVAGNIPLMTLVPLVVLAGGFQAIHALHVGAERIGRYLQVFYEDGGTVPRWETAAMALGPALPGGGIDPLFTALFVCAGLLNLLPTLLAGPTPVELGAVALAHVGFLFHVGRARRAAARQREADLERYRALRDAAGRLQQDGQ